MAAGFGISLASRSFAVSAAATEFDQLLDSARTIARELEGATLAFTPDAYGDGTEVRLLARDANGGFTATTVPVLHARATFEETEALGKVPFAFIVHANGSLGGRANYRAGDATSTSEVGCPPSGAFHFVIRAAGTTADRYVLCRVKLAANGPVALTTWPVAPLAASPTPCSTGACTATSLPSAPVSSPTCPPNFNPIIGGCAPTTAPGGGARYHVTVTGAPATMTVGATSAFTAQAALTNAASVAPGTPTSIPVSIKQGTPAVCNAAPPGWQPSASTFTLNALAAGTCTVIAQADASGVPGASADSATVSIVVSAQPLAAPTSSPAPCDLTSSGKCYHRVAAQTGQLFMKHVYPDVRCDPTDAGTICSYVDSIRQILLEPAYGVLPPTPAIDADHELLFIVEKIVTVERQCQPFAFFDSTVPGTSVALSGDGTGAPVDAPVGFGQPSIYSTVNHVAVGTTPTGGFIEPTTWAAGPVLTDLFAAVAFRRVGEAYQFTFSSPSMRATDYVQWYPDFPGCDASGSYTSPAQYGDTGVQLVFEVYQAHP